MKENFLNLVKEIHIQVQEAQRVPDKMDVKRTTPIRIIITMSKVKNNLTIARGEGRRDSGEKCFQELL